MRSGLGPVRLRSIDVGRHAGPPHRQVRRGQHGDGRSGQAQVVEQESAPFEGKDGEADVVAKTTPGFFDGPLVEGELEATEDHHLKIVAILEVQGEVVGFRVRFYVAIDRVET